MARHVRRLRLTRREREVDRVRRASIVVLRGVLPNTRTRLSWVSDLNRVFRYLYSVDHTTTFARALRVYADELEGLQNANLNYF